MATAFLDGRAYPGFYPTVDTDARTAAAILPLGAKAADRAGNEYTYVRAGGVIAIRNAVKASGTEGLEAVIVTANTATGDPFLGVAGAAFTDNQYGWIQTRGLAVVTAGDVTAGATVIPSDTAATMNDMTAADWTTKAAQAVSDDSGGLASIYMP